MFRTQHEQQIERQQDRAAEISISKTATRDFVRLILGRDLRQKRVVKNERRAEADVGDDEQHTTKQIQVVCDEEHQTVSNDGDVAEHSHQTLLEVRVVAEGAQNRQQEDLRAD